MKVKLTLSIFMVIFLLSSFYLNFNLDVVKTELDVVKTELTSGKSELTSAKEELTSTRENLSTVRQQLDVAQNELTSAQNTLDTTRQELTSTRSVLEAANKELASTKDTLKSNQETFKSIQDMWDSNQLALKSAQSELTRIRESLKLYEETYGKVYSSLQTPYVDTAGSQIKLVNNYSSSNPTWEQLQQFCQEDLSDERFYDQDAYNCFDYARDLHNNAEEKGIKAAFVTIEFKDEPVGHALNAFKTTDGILVFVDVTGVHEGRSKPRSMDTTAIVKLGRGYLRQFIFQRGYYIEDGYQKIWRFNEGSIVTGIQLYW